MNIQQLRHLLKVKWLLYYRQNRPWLLRMRIWGTYNGQRRPSSSFILATLSSLEPQLTQSFPFIVTLSDYPDQIVTALGLNFDPDAELKLITEAKLIVETNSYANGLSMTMLSSGITDNNLPFSTQATNLPSWVDEFCSGI